jgi:hypothetical protein
MIAIGMTRSGQVRCASPGARAHCDLEHRATPFCPASPCRAEQVAIGIKLPELLLTLPKI